MLNVVDDSLFDSFVFDSDSYKYSHFLQVPKGTRHVSSYIEPRDGSVYPEVVHLGPQRWIKTNLLNPLTQAAVDLAREMITEHGEPFDYEGMSRIVNVHGGYFPLEIESLPEGMVVPAGTATVQVINTDDQLPNTSFVETSLLRGVWYPTTVATRSFHIKRIIRSFLQDTCSDDPDGQLLFKLHDFGARGASSRESAAIGGVAHLVNFRGTDTISAVVDARRYFQERMAGFSIPAAEHSTITAWKRDRENAAYANMLEQFGGVNKMFAVVIDSYDTEKAVSQIWGKELRDKVLASGSTVVLRPDSGDPVVLVPRLITQLAKDFGATLNAKGFYVLNKAVRMLWGDGINELTIRSILGALKALRFSAENIAFGMGGALLQGVTRDTCGFAMKASSMQTDADGWYDVYKDPITQQSKRSKKGILAVVERDGKICTIRRNELLPGEVNLLRPIYRNGQLLVDDSLSVIRQRADAAL